MRSPRTTGPTTGYDANNITVTHYRRGLQPGTIKTGLRRHPGPISLRLLHRSLDGVDINAASPRDDAGKRAAEDTYKYVEADRSPSMNVAVTPRTPTADSTKIRGAAKQLDSSVSSRRKMCGWTSATRQTTS